MLTRFIPVALLAAHSALAAQYPVSGIGRAIDSIPDPSAVFSPSAFNNSVVSIVNSVQQGQNRSLDHVIPVPKIYGVNLGNWLIAEAWMSPSRWLAMGGELCTGDCSQCRLCEWALATHLGQEKTNEVFQAHWRDWFTQADVDRMVGAGLNTVRIPIGFWILEDIVDREKEPYAQGGMDELIRGLTMIEAAGLNVILDHHALPGVSSSLQVFAGNCTNKLEFYDSPNDYNYHRGLAWSVVMTWLSHVHPAFSSVFGIMGLNEPTPNFDQTPGIGRFDKAFVLSTRALELSLGIICDTSFLPEAITDPLTLRSLSSAIPIITRLAAKYNLPALGVSGLQNITQGSVLGDVVRSVGLDGMPPNKGYQRECISTTFMNRDWQYDPEGNANGGVTNPSDYAHGPTLYDSHNYFDFGGVDQTEQGYIEAICHFTRVADNAGIGNAPLVFGEWSLATSFAVSDDFLRTWGDAQKVIYSKGAGWLFLNFKVDTDARVESQKMWSYFDAVDAGVLTKDPGTYFNPEACAGYRYCGTKAP